jgi:hypothetical protein
MLLRNKNFIYKALEFVRFSFTKYQILKSQLNHQNLIWQRKEIYNILISEI